MIDGNIPDRKMIDDEVYRRTGTIDQSDKKYIDDKLYDYDIKKLTNLWDSMVTGDDPSDSFEWDPEELQLTPVIVSTDDSNIVNYNDIRENGYSPKRDDEKEVLLRQIDKRELPQAFKYNVKTAEELYSLFGSLVRYTYNKIEKLIGFMNHAGTDYFRDNIGRQYNTITSLRKKTYDLLMFIDKVISDTVDYSVKEDKSDTFIQEDLKKKVESLYEYQGDLKTTIQFACDNYNKVINFLNFEITPESSEDDYKERDDLAKEYREYKVDINDSLEKLKEKCKDLYSIVEYPKEPKKYYIGNNQTKTEAEMKQYFPQDEIYSDENIKNVREEK